MHEYENKLRKMRLNEWFQQANEVDSVGKKKQTAKWNSVFLSRWFRPREQEKTRSFKVGSMLHQVFCSVSPHANL